MICKLCKHEFCWICKDAWSKHGTATGGFYKCNRYEAAAVDDDNGDDAGAPGSTTTGTKLTKGDSKMTEETKRAREVTRFMHYFKRFKAHDGSLAMERKLLLDCDEKIAYLNTLVDPSSSPISPTPSTSSAFDFIRDCIDELLLNRLTLRNSYVYGYYLPDSPVKIMFEQLQDDMERYTETLSDMVGRRAILKTKEDMISTALIACRKR